MQVLVLNSAAKKRYSKDAEALTRDFDVVLTAYSLLKDSPVLKVKWHRLLLDESQSVKSPGTNHTKQCASIVAHRRWALSGTPMPKAVDDLLGQLQALQTAPYDNPRIWREQLQPTLGLKRNEKEGNR